MDGCRRFRVRKYRYRDERNIEKFERAIALRASNWKKDRLISITVPPPEREPMFASHKA